tara:strand:- start:112 stop:582 length:471 start_codon:yes stop_codon:yes gene_type:complete
MNNNELSDSLMITAYCKSKYFKKDYCMFVPNLIWHLFGAGRPNDMLVYGFLMDACKYPLTRNWRATLWSSEMLRCFASTSGTNTSRLVHSSLDRLERAKHFTRTVLKQHEDLQEAEWMFELKTHFEPALNRATYDPMYADDKPNKALFKKEEEPMW